MTERAAPASVELCVRALDGGLPCLGRIHRRGVDGTLPYCVRCGRETGGVRFQRVDAPGSPIALADPATPDRAPA